MSNVQCHGDTDKSTSHASGSSTNSPKSHHQVSTKLSSNKRSPYKGRTRVIKLNGHRAFFCTPRGSWLATPLLIVRHTTRRRDRVRGRAQFGCLHPPRRVTKNQE